jgi:hypothetical protein
MSDTTEMVASYEQDGRTYQIDHLGICYPSQRGDYAVYCDDMQVAEFTPGGLSVVLPEDIDTAELIAPALAGTAVRSAERALPDHPRQPRKAT